MPNWPEIISALTTQIHATPIATDNPAKIPGMARGQYDVEQQRRPAGAHGPGGFLPHLGQ